MTRFQVHPDGHIIIERDGILYIESRELFAADCAALAIAAPEDLPLSEFYSPESLHCGYTEGTQHAPAMDASALDACIAAADRFVAAKKARDDALAATAKAAADAKALADALAAGQIKREAFYRDHPEFPH